MRRIALISCAKRKLGTRASAANLYVSTLFRLSLQYACTFEPDAIFVLSAKHGLLALNDEVEPYEVTLNDMASSVRKAWASNVIAQLQALCDLEKDHFIILAGVRYREYLTSQLSSYEIPLQGLPLGKQLQFLKERLHSE